LQNWLDGAAALRQPPLGYWLPRPGGCLSATELPCVPVSHPFIERLIGTVRREYLDRVLFWNSVDLTRKLDAFRDYYNAFRVHRSLDGTTPAQHTGATLPAPASLDHHAWRQHCGGLFQPPP